MRKVTALKRWATISEAVDHLSSLTREAFTESDLLQLALDGHVTLSVRFYAHVLARHATRVPLEEARKKEIPHPTRSDEKLTLFDGVQLTDGTVMQLDSERTLRRLEGVWDIPMIAGDRTRIERDLQQHFQFEPPQELVNLDGVYVFSADKGYYLLQQILRRKRNPDKAGPLWLEESYPIIDFPDDAVLVLRTEELARLTGMLLPPPSESHGVGKQSSRERDSMLRLILAMAIDGYGFDPAARRSPIASEIANATDRLGIPVSDDTIRNYLAAAVKLVPAKVGR